MPIGFYDKIIIADTSCFIAFDNIGSLGILQAICPAIITTPEVAVEYGKVLPEWIQIMPVKDIAKIKTINTFLGMGESSAIALAIEMEKSIVILDDKKARRYAQDIGLDIIGIIGLLRLGYKQGLIPEIDTIIARLKKIGFRMPVNIEELMKGINTAGQALHPAPDGAFRGRAAGY